MFCLIGKTFREENKNEKTYYTRIGCWPWVVSFAGSASAAEFKPFAQFAEKITYGDAGSHYSSDRGVITDQSSNDGEKLSFYAYSFWF